MAVRNFDLVVLGGGSGGIATAVRAALHGARVAMLEPGAIGGTCVNVGCVPKKAMWLAAELAAAQKLAHELGFAGTTGALDWPVFVQRRDAYIGNIHASYRRRLDAVGVECFAEYGRFLAPDRIAAGDDEFVASHVVIATGSRPQRPGHPRRGTRHRFERILRFARGSAPRRHRRRRLHRGGTGRCTARPRSDVSLFVRSRRLLADFDEELVDELAQLMKADGIDLRRRLHVDGVTQRDDGYALTLGSGEVVSGFDELIWATGRRANTEALGLSDIGVELDADANVVTDDWQDTRVAGVHALGDVTGRLALTPVAVASGRRLADRLFGGKSEAKLDYRDVPTVVFAHPPLATVGCSEEEARRRYGDSVRVFRTRFRPMRAALAGSEKRMFMKLICSGDNAPIVGIHILGPGADEMLQGFAVALKAGARKADFDATVAIHPTSSEELVLMDEPGNAFVGAAD